MSVKVNKDELYKLPAIEIYKMVIRKDIGTFPNGFWQTPKV